MRPEKNAIINEVREKVEASGYLMLTDYKGLNVDVIGALRDELRKQDSEVHVVKNTFLGKALEAAGMSGLEAVLQGPTAMVTGNGDVAQVAQLLSKFAKDHEKEIKGGCLEGGILSAEDIKALAALPSRDVLLGSVVGTIAAPMTQLVGVFNQKVSSLLYVLKAVENKKAEGQ
jgi:large subunit ribosomal protein L10